mmetsp:Transcript_17188/g.23620  ORF Transcript_17188/g.23620 Transcript_17188/m.23620 type:complete len:87 (-) Transcript_17188:214-474(-)
MTFRYILCIDEFFVKFIESTRLRVLDFRQAISGYGNLYDFRSNEIGSIILLLNSRRFLVRAVGFVPVLVVVVAVLADLELAVVEEN